MYVISFSYIFREWNSTQVYVLFGTGTLFSVFSSFSSGLDWCAMQRSRRALLQRRALGFGGRRLLYKVSLSLVFVLWGLVFLFSLWFSRGDGYRGNLSTQYNSLLLASFMNCLWISEIISKALSFCSEYDHHFLFGCKTASDAEFSLESVVSTYSCLPEISARLLHCIY